MWISEDPTTSSVYVKAKDTNEWKASDPQIKLLDSDFTVDKISTLPNNSLIFIDDFQKQCSDSEFQTIVNYTLRHERKTLILSIHDIYKSKLYSDIFQSTHFFITYSPSASKFLQLIDKQYCLEFRKKFQKYYPTGIKNKDIAFVNTNTQIFVESINTVLSLSGKTKMFLFDDSVLSVHPIEMPCSSISDSPSASSTSPPQNDIPLFLYPKWQKRGEYVLKHLHAFLDPNNCLTGKRRGGGVYL